MRYLAIALKTTLTLILTTTLSAANPAKPDRIKVRYTEPSGRMSMSISQDIIVKGDEPIAGRTFSFEFAVATDRATSGVTVTIDRAKATYTAHGSEERLGTRRLTNRSFSLLIGDHGRRLEQTEASEEPIVQLDAAVSDGLSIARAFADFMPELPEEPVAAGSTWTTQRQVRSLEGWSWATGLLTSVHRVNAVEQRNGRTIITVTTEAAASLGPVETDRTYIGDLKQNLRWTFDATEGRLISMSVDQEARSVSALPRGEIPVRQLTRVELAPLS